MGGPMGPPKGPPQGPPGMGPPGMGPPGMGPPQMGTAPLNAGIGGPPNLLQLQDELKGWPDDRLIQEMQAPSGVATQYLFFTELSRLGDVRER